jgi:hypothetical protein
LGAIAFLRLLFTRFLEEPKNTMKTSYLKRFVMCALFVVITIYSLFAHAFLGLFYSRHDINVTAKVEAQVTAGLDEQTRKLIEGLLPAARTEFVKGVSEALTKVDASIDHAAKAFEGATERTLNRINCQVRVLALKVPSDIIEQFKRYPKDTSVKLWHQYTERALGFNAATARNIANEYVGISNQAYVLACYGLEADGVSDLNTTRETAHIGYAAWSAAALDCKALDQCLETRYKAVSDFISASDNFDIERAKARTRLQAVKLHTVPDTWMYRLALRVPFSRKLGLKPAWLYQEDGIIKLYQIQRDVMTARMMRTLGELEFENAQTGLGEVSTQIIRARARGSVSNPADSVAAIDMTTAAEVELREITSVLDIVANAEPTLRQKIKPLQGAVISREACSIYVRTTACQTLRIMKSPDGRCSGGAIGANHTSCSWIQ